MIKVTLEVRIRDNGPFAIKKAKATIFQFLNHDMVYHSQESGLNTTTTAQMTEQNSVIYKSKGNL